MSEVIEYESGHRCVPNGAGDFNLTCPKHGVRPGFIPYMYARCVVSQKVCDLCERPIGPIVNRATQGASGK
jgi:hypothetical protein